MSSAGGDPGRAALGRRLSARRRAEVVSGLRLLARSPGRGWDAERPDRGEVYGLDPGGGDRPDGGRVYGLGPEGGDRPDGRGADAGGDPAAERCEICQTTIQLDHRHLLQLTERRIVCVCEACWALRAGEGDYRPTGARTLWLDDLRLPDELWASFRIPVGLAFLMRSTVTGGVLALYPSPGGAVESELDGEGWERMCELNPVLEGLEADIEGLIVNRTCQPPAYAIAPIDRCYALTGAVRAAWEGIGGGDGPERAVGRFFAELRRAARAA